MKQPERNGIFGTGEGVTLGGSLINLVLVAVKAVAGVLGGSAALVADALHSLSDLATDIVVLVGYRVGRMPEDADHPYGHGKVETVATAVVGAMLVLVGLGLGWGAARGLAHPPEMPPGVIALVAALLSVVAKEGLYRWTVAVAHHADSQLLLANAWHHRSDALSSVAALVGVIGARWGFGWMDPAAAGVVGLFVIKVGWDLAWQASRDLIDTAVDDGLAARIVTVVQGVKGVRGHHGLRTRRLGKDVLVDVDVEVDPDLNVVQGHDVARAVKLALLERVKGVRDAMVHVEPLGARPGGPHACSVRREIVATAEALARDTGGVLGVHGTRVVPLPDGYLLNLDVEVAPDLTVRHAHEIAHDIKTRVRDLPGVADAVIHVDVHGESDPIPRSYSPVS